MEGVDVFTSAQSFKEEDVRGKTAVIIDVLRATTTIITALHNGAAGLIPVADMDEVNKIAKNLDSSQYLLCGEKNGVKIEGYHLGNSPLEYTPDNIEGKTLIFKTSNGTQAIARAGKAKEILIGSFLNIDSVVEALREKERDIVLICAGWRGRLAIEDMLCAGQIVHQLYDGKLPERTPDGAKMAFSLYEKYADRIDSVIKDSNHAVRLQETVNGDDVMYSCQLNSINILPVLNDRIINVTHGEQEK